MSFSVAKCWKQHDDGMAVSGTFRRRRRSARFGMLLVCCAVVVAVLQTGRAFAFLPPRVRPARRVANGGVSVDAGVLSVGRMARRALGIPKVAYRMPGAQNAEWIDIYSRLYRERIIFLGKEINDQVANDIIGVLLYLDAEDSSKPIYLYINSVGGSVVSGLAIYDTMQHISSPVVTINIGLAASMASFLLASGEKGRRLALPNSRVMIHQVMGAAEGQAEDIRVESQQILKIHEDIVHMYATMTGKDSELIRTDLLRDNYMSAQEAKDYGLIDQVIRLEGTSSLLDSASKSLSGSVAEAFDQDMSGTERDGPQTDAQM